MISDGGTRVLSAPPAQTAPWRWQRALHTQALPLAAAMQGLEVMHASAVALSGGAALFTGPSGTGKTTLALHLAARGAGFMADDVVALEPGETGVLAHRGTGVLNLPPAHLPLLRELGGAEVLGRGRKLLVALAPAADVAPVRALYLLERNERLPEPVVDRVAAPPVGALLGSTFIGHVDEPLRLMNQLEVAARVATTVPTYRVAFPHAAGPVRLADVIEAHARDATR
jgi:hypothetical protein